MPLRRRSRQGPSQTVLGFWTVFCGKVRDTKGFKQGVTESYLYFEKNMQAAIWRLENRGARVHGLFCGLYVYELDIFDINQCFKILSMSTHRES